MYCRVGNSDHDYDAAEDVEAGFVEEGDVEHDSPVAADVVVEDGAGYSEADEGMHDRIQHFSISFPFIAVAENPAPQHRAVNWPSLRLVLPFVIIIRKEQVRRCRPEMGDDAAVA